MSPEEVKRLEFRVETCQREWVLACQKTRAAAQDMSFWSNELAAAQAELHGFKQGELNLTGC